MNHIKIVLSEKDIEKFWKYVDKKSEDECWEWVGATTMGYGRITIKNKRYGAHRVSWVLHNEEIPEELLVCHTCDNPGCVNPHHLFLGAQQDNVKDREEKERGAEGEKHGRSKLTEQQVVEIREKYIPHKYTLTMLAKEYGVYHSTILRIVKHMIWKHLIDGGEVDEST